MSRTGGAFTQIAQSSLSLGHLLTAQCGGILAQGVWVKASRGAGPRRRTGLKPPADLVHKQQGGVGHQKHASRGSRVPSIALSINWRATSMSSIAGVGVLYPYLTPSQISH